MLTEFILALLCNRDGNLSSGTVNNVALISYLITDIEEISGILELNVSIGLADIELSYNDLSEGFYDKEDGVWYNTEYVSIEKSYIATYKISVKFCYEILESEPSHFEFCNIEQIDLLDFEEG